jgi:hypothetical protein
MKRFSEQFKKKADNIYLSMSEKTDLRERVVSYMEYHPLPNTTKKVSGAVFNDEMPFKMVKVNTWKFFKLSAALVVILAVSVSYLAEKAVPGDALYAVKVGINEEMRSTLARGSYEKVVWETERLNRRISEARLLADEGRLTVEVEEQVADAVRVHSENARKEIENLKLTDKDEATMASIELATALDVQTTSLRNRSEDKPEGQSTNLIEIVLEESQAIEVSAGDDSLPAFDRLMAKVESETTRAHELLVGVKKSATLDEQNDISRRLEDIERKIGVVMQMTDTQDMAPREALVEVLQQTHRLIVFMTNIDVRASVTVDEIVPVTLTLEERVALVKSQSASTAALLVLVNNTLNATSSVEIEADILNKIKPAIEQSSTTLEKVLAILATEPVDIETAEGSSLDAYNLISDSALLLNVVAPLPSEEVLVPVEGIEVEATTTEEVIEETEPIEVGTTTTEEVIEETEPDSV